MKDTQAEQDKYQMHHSLAGRLRAQTQISPAQQQCRQSSQQVFVAIDKLTLKSCGKLKLTVWKRRTLEEPGYLRTGDRAVGMERAGLEAWGCSTEEQMGHGHGAWRV